MSLTLPIASIHRLLRYSGYQKLSISNISNLFVYIFRMIGAQLKSFTPRKNRSVRSIFSSRCWWIFNDRTLVENTCSAFATKIIIITISYFYFPCYLQSQQSLLSIFLGDQHCVSRSFPTGSFWKGNVHFPVFIFQDITHCRALSFC